ncbi:TetR/AcrR family transcriptional regulator [Seleniivibrio woodruffii]|uniref:TetR/AcrR family transcriptional regulator n=1 Tax=Seleniivibrio woodruffii TaxID=1078050 RepID=UPI00240A055D|nr:TetR/AcrR family transcriptional regulator [Seleniivibrio woodruffii]
MPNVLSSELLNKLFVLFSQKLYKDISIEDIAKELGMSRRSFYNYFTSKDECFLYVIRYVSDIFISELIRRSLNISNDHLSVLESILDFSVEATIHNGFFNSNVRSFTLNPSSQEILADYSAYYQEFKDKFESILKKQISLCKPELDDPNITIKTFFVMTMFLGLDAQIYNNLISGNNTFDVDFFKSEYKTKLLHYIMNS